VAAEILESSASRRARAPDGATINLKTAFGKIGCNQPLADPC
jgi:hypothetical protein